MPRFAVLIHDSPRGLHYDFFLESGDVLRTWALPQAPEPGSRMDGEALPDHRLIYLDYEGPISDGRGTVTCWDRGGFTCETWTDDEIVVSLLGERLCGRVELHRMSQIASTWRFVASTVRQENP
jgi:hypothetical protein